MKLKKQYILIGGELGATPYCCKESVLALLKESVLTLLGITSGFAQGTINSAED